MAKLRIMIAKIKGNMQSDIKIQRMSWQIGMKMGV